MTGLSLQLDNTVALAAGFTLLSDKHTSLRGLIPVSVNLNTNRNTALSSDAATGGC
ncbi:MAG: hypothetical protein V3W41_04810 [Planctomycetota bacterium]